MVERWQQLPLDHALSSVPLVRDVVEWLAGQVPVPDLGPAVVMDQLTVLVYDSFADPDPSDTMRTEELTRRLASLRQAL